MKAPKTNSLKEFTDKFIQSNIIDELNPRAIEHLQSPSEKNFFAIQKTNLARKLIKFPIPPHRVDFYEILFVIKGRNIRKVNSQEFELGEGSCSVTLPGQIVQDNLLSETIEGYHIYFDALFCQSIGQQLIKLRLLNEEYIHYAQLSSAENHRLLFLCERIEELYIEDRNDDLLHLYFTTLIYELNGILRESGSSKPMFPGVSKAHQFKRLVHLKPNLLKSVSEFANELKISPKHLNKLSQLSFGKSANTIKAEAIIENAKFMLRNSEMTIAEISAELGFDDLSYFGRYFKKYTGSSPKIWQRSLQ